MRAEIYNQLIKLGFEDEEARPMREEFALMLQRANNAGGKALRWVARLVADATIESLVMAILF
jgi:hypothetical protein